jgi:glucose-6-phosphate dehydrogenase assembly protein OpcA
MNSSLTYSPVEVGAISKSLAALFETETEDQVITRASATNVIVSGATLERLARVTELVELIAPVHPARFFIPVMDPAASTMRAEVAAACVRVSNGSDVCSEVVRIYFPASLRSAVPSVIRAHMLPGLSSEVFEFSWDESSQQLIKQCDQLYFDAQSLPPEDLLTLLDGVSHLKVPMVDFNWVRLGIWREEIKRTFDMPITQTSLPHLVRVRIESADFSPGKYDASAYTLAGWIAYRLGCELIAYSRDGWECKRRSGGSITFQITAPSGVDGVNNPDQSGVTRVSLDAMRSGSTTPENSSKTVAWLVKSDVLETHIEGEEGVVFKRALEKDDLMEVIERFFLVGDSTVNYDPALKLGLEMFRLTRGFAE